MARQTKEESALEARIGESYRRATRGRLINVLKIGPLLTQVRAELRAGRLLDDAMRDAVEAFCEPVQDTHGDRPDPCAACGAVPTPSTYSGEWVYPCNCGDERREGTSFDEPGQREADEP